MSPSLLGRLEINKAINNSKFSVGYLLKILFLLYDAKRKNDNYWGGVDKGSFTEHEFTDQVENNLNFFEKGILRRLLDESSDGLNSRIEVVPTASKIPKIVGDEYAKAFHFLGAENVGVLNITNRKECENSGVIDRIKKANIVFLLEETNFD